MCLFVVLSTDGQLIDIGHRLTLRLIIAYKLGVGDSKCFCFCENMKFRNFYKILSSLSFLQFMSENCRDNEIMGTTKFSFYAFFLAPTCCRDAKKLSCAQLCGIHITHTKRVEALFQNQKKMLCIIFFFSSVSFPSNILEDGTVQVA